MTTKDDEKLEITPAALEALAKGDLANAMRAMTPGGIEAQEAAGQAQFVGDSCLSPFRSLPIECPREQLEKLGFQFGDSISDLFISVQFPDGWTKVPTEHSMWSDLVDDKGRVRGHIFYKAAFYDQRAHINSLKCRYSAVFMPEDRYLTEITYEDRDRGKWAGMVIDYSQSKDGVIIWQTGWHKFEINEKQWSIEKELLAEAHIWLRENYPNYDDPLAYWD